MRTATPGMFRFVAIGYVTAGPDLAFVGAMVPEANSPLALVFYEVNGKRSQSGIRIDMDKRSFIDRPNGTTTDPNADGAAERVASALYTIRGDGGN